MNKKNTKRNLVIALLIVFFFCGAYTALKYQSSAHQQASAIDALTDDLDTLDTPITESVDPKKADEGALPPKETVPVISSVPKNSESDLPSTTHSPYVLGSFLTQNYFPAHLNDTAPAQKQKKLDIESAEHYSLSGTNDLASSSEPAPILANDLRKPLVDMLDPVNGMTLAYSVLLQATAEDPMAADQLHSGLEAVMFYVDGVQYGSEIPANASSSIYSIIIDTTHFSDGAHMLGVQARDGVGHVSEIDLVSVTFANNTSSGANVIRNPSLEETLDGLMPTYWYQGYQWGVSSTTYAYLDSGNTGGRSGSIIVEDYQDGDSKWYFEDVPVIPGSEYTFSDMYTASTPTRVVARFTKDDGSYLYQEFSSAVPAAESWTQYTHTFTVPLNENIVSMTVFHAIVSNGTITVDDFFLAPTTVTDPFSAGMVSFDFDDGWRSTYENALPILNAAGFKSTHYIITGEFDNPAYVGETEVLAMRDTGHEINAHTRTHPDLTTLTPEQVMDEVLGSKEDLEAIGIHPLVAIAYPYGQWNQSIVDAVKAAGYIGARTALIADGGFNFQNDNPFTIKTMSIELGTNLETIKEWIDTAALTNTWLVLVFHQIEDGGQEFSTTPARLSEIVNYVASKNIEVVTASQGIYRMTHR